MTLPLALSFWELMVGTKGPSPGLAALVGIPAIAIVTVVILYFRVVVVRSRQVARVAAAEIEALGSATVAANTSPWLQAILVRSIIAYLLVAFAHGAALIPVAVVIGANFTSGILESEMYIVGDILSLLQIAVFAIFAWSILVDTRARVEFRWHFPLPRFRLPHNDLGEIPDDEPA